MWKREQIRAKQAAGATWLCQAIASYRGEHAWRCRALFLALLLGLNKPEVL